MKHIKFGNKMKIFTISVYERYTPTSHFIVSGNDVFDALNFLKSRMEMVDLISKIDNDKSLVENWNIQFPNQLMPIKIEINDWEISELEDCMINITEPKILKIFDL